MRILLLTAFLIFVPNLFGQTKGVNDLNVRGLDIGSRYTVVLKLIGRPRRWTSGGELGCYSGPSKIADYGGLRIRFDLKDNGKSDRVASISVTSPKWSVSGIRVGADLKTVLRTFKVTRSTDVDAVSYGGLIEDGYVRFYFEGDKLTRIYWELNYC